MFNRDQSPTVITLEIDVPEKDKVEEHIVSPLTAKSFASFGGRG